MRLKKTQFFKLLILILIIIEILIIFFVGSKIINKKKTKFIPLNKENIKKPITSSYKYYYEPTSGELFEPISWDKGKTVKYTINKDTIRAKREYSINKDKNKIRIITIGDSFTYGQMEEDENTYPKQLENKLNDKSRNKYEVINLGVPGYDTAFAAERYRLRGEKYKPDLVLWFLIDNDFTNISELELGMAEYYEKNLPEEERKKYEKIYGDYVDAALGSQDVLKRLTSEGIVKKSLKEIEKLSSILKNKLIIMTFEHLDHEYKEGVKKICLKNKCQFIDNLPNIYLNNKLYFPDDHPTRYGYEKIVNYLYPKILKIKI